MSMCSKCGASWTTMGMTLCPICGAKVGPETRTPEPSKEKLPSGPKRDTSALDRAGGKRNGTAVLGAVPESSESAQAVAVEPSPPGAPALPSPRAAAFPRSEEQGLPSAPVQALEPALREAPKPPAKEPTARVDASVVLLQAPSPAGEPKRLPVSSRPLNAPWILGILALVTGILLPVTVVFESHRILGIIGFCMSGFFVPFAPIAWIAGLSAEKRRREQGLRPERRVVIGRILGQWGTLLLVAEVTAALILIAGLRLAGNLPMTFWQQARF
ncbi:MAG TPA: hypothetical protein VKU80_00840 [Planctomycetota bacterium]|nr:hypothetical protein [Planctomycetota bacterium]